MKTLVRLALSTVPTLIVILALSLFSSLCAEDNGPPRPKLITLDLDTKEYARVLSGPPETVTMRSGLVVLAPGKSVGRHSTKSYEEVLVVLEGTGKMDIAGGSLLELRAGTVAYCPPRTEHNVTCTGSRKLKYLYIVAKAE